MMKWVKEQIGVIMLCLIVGACTLMLVTAVTFKPPVEPKHEHRVLYNILGRQAIEYQKACVALLALLPRPEQRRDEDLPECVRHD